jgi:ribosomal RNA-processing protein 9
LVVYLLSVESVYGDCFYPGPPILYPNHVNYFLFSVKKRAAAVAIITSLLVHSRPGSITMSKKRQAAPERDLLAGLDDDQLTAATTQQQQQERLRKARTTITKLEQELAGHDDDDGEVDARLIDKEIIAERLRKAAVEAKGQRSFQYIADPLQYGRVAFTLKQTLRSEHRGHPITRLVASSSDPKMVFSADKSGNIIKWTWDGDSSEWRKQHVFKADHAVHSLALSPDNNVLLGGLGDGTILAWNAQTNKRLGKLGPNEHRQAVTSLAFQPGSLTAFSASSDRTVKIWAVDQLAYIDTVYGHQDQVLSVASPGPDRCVTVGCRDRTMRLWKIAEESQLVFRMSESQGGSLEEVAVSGRWFITGSDTGVLAVWSSGKKKPVFSVSAHSSPITCLLCPEATDLLISAGSDGLVKLWRVNSDEDRKNKKGEDREEGDPLELVNELPIPGHIAGAALVGADKLMVAVSPEGRFGRWTVDKSIKPSVLVFDLSFSK